MNFLEKNFMFKAMQKGKFKNSVSVIFREYFCEYPNLLLKIQLKYIENPKKTYFY